MADASSSPSLSHALDALRARGVERFDPVRFRFIEALARRSGDHQGAARRVLDDKLARLVAAYERDATVDATEPAPADTSCRIDAAPPRSALAELVDLIGRRAAAPSEGPGHDTRQAQHAASDPGRPASLAHDALPYFRQTWARLSVEQRLAQSRSALPDNAGPLNSHHLVHRALTSMRELAPAYLDRFIAYADALLWMEQTQDGTLKDALNAQRAAGEKKSARGRQA